MSVLQWFCLELGIYDYSLGDMILSARDRLMITNECFTVIFVWISGFTIVILVNDMILSARDRFMITNECFTVILFGCRNLRLFSW